MRQDSAYLLNRDAFTLLAMKFTGKKALAWQLQYIEAFNSMEAALRQQAAS
jgi:Rha family phage regulatory protein